MLTVLMVAAFMCGGYNAVSVERITGREAHVACITTGERMTVLATPSMREGVVWGESERLREQHDRRWRIPTGPRGDVAL